MTTALPQVLPQVLAENATPSPILLGLFAFGTLLAALLLVSRWNKDR